MKMKNFEILNANDVLSQIGEQPLKGTFKFKIFNIKAALENKAETVFKSIEGLHVENDQEELNEIMEIEQEIDIQKITQEELIDVDLSIKQISMMKSLIEFEGDV